MQHHGVREASLQAICWTHPRSPCPEHFRKRQCFMGSSGIPNSVNCSNMFEPKFIVFHCNSITQEYG
jgi:hypothetical protein